MERLWTPWRMEYVSDDHKEHRCVFCDAIKAKSQNKKHLVLKRSSKSFIVMNKYPYANGHVMVVPNRHVGDLADLKKSEITDLFQTVQLAENMINRAFCPQGFNIGINLGAVAGAGMPGHLHVHIVPRWQGDTNFMPVSAKTKVIPETLSKTFDRFKKYC